LDAPAFGIEFNAGAVGAGEDHVGDGSQTVIGEEFHRGTVDEDVQLDLAVVVRLQRGRVYLRSPLARIEPRLRPVDENLAALPVVPTTVCSLSPTRTRTPNSSAGHSSTSKVAMISSVWP
jgi:hypothetical protein